MELAEARLLTDSMLTLQSEVLPHLHLQTLPLVQYLLFRKGIFMIEPFNANALVRRISATTSASSSTALPNTGTSLRVHNTGTSTAYFHVTTGTAAATVPTGTAASTCCSVGAGQDAVFSIPSDVIYNISAITETGSTNLEVSVGGGL